MTKALKWRIAILLVIVFCAGAATGFFGAVHHARQMFWERRSFHAGERMREHLRRHLDLSSDQDEKISPLLDQMSKRLDVIRDDTSKRVAETMTESYQQMLPMLTAEQRAKLEQVRERHRRMLHMHGALPPPDAP